MCVIQTIGNKSKTMTDVIKKQNSLIFTANGAPFSSKFGDIYFDSETGCHQSQQIFIEGNQLRKRLSECSKNAQQATLTIAETGFGSGLNFLLTLRAYHLARLAHKKNNNHFAFTKLTFVSVEKYPLTKQQISQALTLFPELQSYSQLLTAQYPELPQDECCLSFYDNNITLRLLVGDATQALSKISRLKSGLVDMWYLDGFSPDKNPQMWNTALFAQIARLSKQQATLATFTVAGFVRRGLTAVGFRLQKQQSIGKKREILLGVFQKAQYGKGYQIRSNNTKPQQVSIVGGGIASACAAYALTKQGIKVILYCKDNKLAQGASSNAIGALFPLIHQLPDDISHFYQQAFWRAKQFYQDIYQQGFEFSHDWCGLLDLAFDDKRKVFQRKFEQLQCWPEALITSVDNETASNIANLPLKDGGLFFPNSGWLAPQECVQQIFNAAERSGLLKIKCDVNVEQINQNTDQSWQLKTNKGLFKAKILLLCGGGEAIKLKVLAQSSLIAIRGQVTTMKANEQSKKLNTVICHQGYLTPQHHEQHCIGATFERGTFNTEAKTSDDIYNLDKLAQCLPNVINWQLNDVITSKARLRCSTPDHFPMLGELPDITKHKAVYSHLAKDKNWKIHTPAPNLNNLYIFSGLGARGLCSAPLLADILVADLCGKPYPVSYQMLANLAPNRFVIRDIIRHKI
jgi:tRNA 5-methylaminomethyl-2-thiouridine biosynthesis bifunctional protein